MIVKKVCNNELQFFFLLRAAVIIKCHFLDLQMSRSKSEINGYTDRLIIQEHNCDCVQHISATHTQVKFKMINRLNLHVRRHTVAPNTIC